MQSEFHPVTYTLSKLDLWDTTLTPSREDYPEYVVKTERTKRKLFGLFNTGADDFETTSRIYKDEGTLIGTLLWKESLPDTVIYNGHSISINKWMDRGLLNGSTTTFKDIHGRSYEWTNIKFYHQLELYAKAWTAPMMRIVTLKRTPECRILLSATSRNLQ
ncbi:hypothetical protein M422DRAFT_269732 [Sphaerobolus stellatus SS14]|uniref:DUF6593 domain-containing protein n=1 Tax=Sphaerobolus stellatus (strain SS14) TaxID=990650 RepID=A0A0C9UJ80_SPHS4|nr:hypothetical protein M422DRAFT_269732 [Sphaerobolus stellatus SS14]